jgi:hypothetical protein
MVKVNFDGVPEFRAKTLIPDGWYPAQIAGIDVRTTRKGDEMWRCTWELLNGEHKSKHVYDNLVFSSGGQSRVKFVLSKLGVDTTGAIDLQPEDIGGRYAEIEVKTEEYPDNEGVLRRRNRVSFAGVRPMTTEPPPF